jgi:hypothetical protein
MYFCLLFHLSLNDTEIWYKWKKRYDIHGMVGLKNQSRKPHTIAKVKVIEELEKIILELRLNSRFGPRRIRFRLKQQRYGQEYTQRKRDLLWWYAGGSLERVRFFMLLRDKQNHHFITKSINIQV